MRESACGDSKCLKNRKEHVLPGSRVVVVYPLFLNEYIKDYKRLFLIRMAVNSANIVTAVID